MSYVARIRLDDGREIDAVLDDADKRYQHYDTREVALARAATLARMAMPVVACRDCDGPCDCVLG
jgi:hypothetical protein